MHSPEMARRTVIARVLVGLSWRSRSRRPALGDDIIAPEAARSTEIAALQGNLAAKQQHEAALRSQIDGVTSRIQHARGAGRRRLAAPHRRSSTISTSTSSGSRS